MARNIVLYIAMSLDGYIAKKNGDVSWLEEHAQGASYTSYEDFYESVDTVVMGHTTFSQIVCELSPSTWPYQGKKCYTATRRPHRTDPRSEFIQDDFIGFVKNLKKENGKDIWLVGGANIIAQLINEDLIDKYIISVMPVILGDGIPLFLDSGIITELNLDKIVKYGGIAELTYTRLNTNPTLK